MPNLLQALRGRSPQPATRHVTNVDDYLQTVNQLEFLYNGYDFTPSWMQSGLTGTYGTPSAEGIANNLEAYARGAYEANGIIFAIMSVRMLAFSAIRFQWQRLNKGRPSEMFGSASLGMLEQPWIGGTTQDLLSRVIQDADLAGNSYWVDVAQVARADALEGVRVPGPQAELVRLRPDWVHIVLEPRIIRGAHVGHRRVGYMYWEGGPHSGAAPAAFLPDEVVHFMPNPDNLADWRGMSWLTPVLREIEDDKSMNRYKSSFLRNNATPNLSVSLDKDVSLAAFQAFKDAMDAGHKGPENAGKTLYLGGGADVKVIGADFHQMDFRQIQGHAETRIAAAGGVPPIIVGLSEGLQSATYCGTYDEAVWTTRGIVKLGEVAPGDAVWSFVNGRIEPRKVTWHSQTGTKPVYTIRTKNRTIRFTDNHPVLVRVPGNSAGSNAERSARVEWRRVDELKVGDRVVQAQRLPDQGLASLPNGQPATPDAMQWLGAYTGDGCLSAGDVVMCIPTDDRARPRYAELASKLFTKQLSYATPGRRATDGLTDEMVRLRGQGLTYRQIVERMKLSLHPMSVRDRVHYATREYEPRTAPVEIRESRNGFRFGSKQAQQWHRDMGVIGDARTKRVPGWVYELSEDLRLAYLAGIVDTDGSVGKDGRLAVQFAGRQLVEDVRMLLISCGIACSNIARVEFKASVLPNPGAQETYEAWRFVASSAVEVGRIPFADPLYRERVDAHRHRHRPGGGDAQKAGLHEDLGFYAIRSIEIGPAEPVFDIEVEDGHSFLVDGVVVHNSNYSQARRRFADGTMHPLWQNVAGSFANIVPKPVSPVAPQDFDNVRLWYESRDVPFLREDRQDAAQIQSTQSGAINALIMAGFEPDTAVKAVMAEDWDLLKHTGLVSVQLLPPGTQTTGQGASSSPAPAAKADPKPDPKPAPKTNKPEVTGA